MFVYLTHTVLFVLFVAALILAYVLYSSAIARAKAKVIAQTELEKAQAEAAKLGEIAIADVVKIEAKL